MARAAGRRHFLGSMALGGGTLVAPIRARSAVAAPSPSGPKTLRVAFEAAESGFDPAFNGDNYSTTVFAHIFEALFAYDQWSRPLRIMPLTAAGPPEHADDFRSWVVRVRPGIFFTDHPAFKGKPRELVAADYVFSFKRFFDPAVNAPASLVADLGILGLEQLGRVARGAKRSFDYDRPIPGLRPLDRYTLQIRTAEPRPRLPHVLASEAYGAMAREVVEAHGREIAAHPVGTGPFRLGHWRRGSRIVLERNRGYRERHFTPEPASGDLEGQSVVQQLGGRRVPLVERVEIQIINEEQPRWLAFLNGEIDVVQAPGEFAQSAMPKGVLAPYLARQGVAGIRAQMPRIRLLVFNMEHPIVGGYASEKVALRRAIGLGMNLPRDAQLVWGGENLPTHSVYAPQQTGFDAAFRSEMGEYSVARARALLDLYGYADRDGDGWREMPDGSPLELEKLSSPDQLTRRENEGFARDMRALGLRTRFRISPFSENIRLARAGKHMLFALGYNAVLPDGHQFLLRYSSRQETFSRFKLAAMDEIYERLATLPDGRERDALLHDAQRLAIAWMPYKHMYMRLETLVTRPWLVGYRRPLFTNAWFHLVDIDPNGLRSTVAER